MDAPSLLLVELIGGPMDGTTFIANSPSSDPRLDVWEQEDRAIAIYRDTNGGEVGSQFSIHADELYRPRAKFAHHLILSDRDGNYVLETDSETFTVHKYRVTDRLFVDGELLIRGEYVSSKEASKIVWGKGKRLPK
ncbi:MAG: hypothetical protein GXY83_19060 [Rhodopirellula sp.]|nr:hypothetical protein [Rhodopirellula sp.]